ncbi:MAG: ferrous iron transport protein A [Bacillota bacterium]|nr:MAG: ferrous iron transport protein A [Bacillota bacterium]
MSAERTAFLAELKAGESGRILGVAGGHGALGRLMALGFVRGREVKVIRNDSLGPVITALGDSRVAVGRGLAWKVRLSRNTRSASRPGKGVSS